MTLEFVEGTVERLRELERRQVELDGALALLRGGSWPQSKALVSQLGGARSVIVPLDHDVAYAAVEAERTKVAQGMDELRAKLLVEVKEYTAAEPQLA
jgi:hypothetical protein